MASITQLVDDIVVDALERNASDIHIAPTATGLNIRYRIDGVLYDYLSYDLSQAAQFLSRVKICANINIVQKRIPQDGKYHITHKGRPIDVRVSTFPSLYGENIVMRILQRNNQIVSLEHSGMNADVYAAFSACIHRSSGFFLVTGPTGSGKTTTLYATIMQLNNAQRHIITLEDPVEYNIHGVTQGNIYPDAGFTFERGIRAVLRQDPDIAMIGEIRDKQTARIAVEAALSGHLILSTLHTKSAPGALVRLVDMGIEPFLVNAAVSGVLAQRLVRKLCNACKQQSMPSKNDMHIMQQLGFMFDSVYTAVGCEDCFGLGYKGRIGIFELLVLSNPVRELLMQKADLDTVYQQAVASGMQPLAVDGFAKIKDGIISVQELARTIL